jgi:hypothetical protein
VIRVDWHSRHSTCLRTVLCGHKSCSIIFHNVPDRLILAMTISECKEICSMNVIVVLKYSD